MNAIVIYYHHHIPCPPLTSSTLCIQYYMAKRKHKHYYTESKDRIERAGGKGEPKTTMPVVFCCVERSVTLIVEGQSRGNSFL